MADSAECGPKRQANASEQARRDKPAPLQQLTVLLLAVRSWRQQLNPNQQSLHNWIPVTAKQLGRPERKDHRAVEYGGANVPPPQPNMAHGPDGQ